MYNLECTMYKPKIFISIIFIIFLLTIPQTIFAKRITPEDIVNSKQVVYQEKVTNYSQASQQKLQKLSDQIAKLNKQRTDELTQIMNIQGVLLDEYESRQNGKNQAAIEKARYWLTFAHEAVAYQAAKIYIFNLTSETNIKSDAGNLVNLFKSELNYARSTVVNSQVILKGLMAK